MSTLKFDKDYFVKHCKCEVLTSQYFKKHRTATLFILDKAEFLKHSKRASMCLSPETTAEVTEEIAAIKAYLNTAEHNPMSRGYNRLSTNPMVVYHYGFERACRLYVWLLNEPTVNRFTRVGETNICNFRGAEKARWGSKGQRESIKRDMRVCDVTLTRAAGKEESLEAGLRARNCRGLELRGVRVVDNWSTAGAISLEGCADSRVENCTVRNYKRIGVDDRTENELYGYAFNVIDGTGIGARECKNLLISGNTVVEDRIFPTPETKQAHRLGQLTEGRKPTNKGRLAPAGDYANNWHQGSAILVTAPEISDHVTISGNVIRNAAQGIDMHADHVTCSGNSIDHAFIGIKCMHGARNVIIMGNNVSHMDLWGLVMLPGTASHPAQPAAEGKPAAGPNFTSGNIIANNIFSDFGFGYEYFNWEGARGGVISLESGQLPENPVMTDVIVQGNIVYDSGKDEVLVEGKPEKIGPRYEYAVFITPEPRPQGIVFANNIFQPGRSGVSNVPLE